MLVPTPRLALVIAAGVVILLPAVRHPIGFSLILGFNLLLAGLVLADALLTERAGALEVRRRHLATLSLGAPARLTLLVRNDSDRRLVVRLRDDLPAELGAREDPPPVTVEPQQTATVGYRITPPVRGRFRLGGVTARWRSRLGLFERQAHWPLAQEVRVYPNLRALQRYQMLQRAGRLLEAGIRAARLRGAGTEFESLREYQPDDEYRRIHWGATARKGKLVSRQYEVERSQTVIFCLDTGRLMTTRLDDHTRLDHAINAILLLAGIATQLQDRVGLLVFAEEPLLYLPPRQGRSQVARVLEAVHDLQGRLIEPDYGAALRLLGLRQRKRSLVVLLTDLIDAQASEALLGYVQALRPAHLPIFVSFTDPQVQALAVKPPETVADVYQRALASKLLHDREQALRRLRAHGLAVVDALPDRAHVELVNRYLEAKVKLLL